MENRNFYIISILILLLIGLFMIPIAGLLIDPAPEPNYLDTPMEELNGYSLRQVYENDLYIDDNLTVLNNHTLREVFEGGQLFTYTDLSANNNTFTIYNNIIEITVTTPTTSGNSSIYKTISPISGNAYYTRYDIYANYNGIKRFLYAGFDSGTTNMVIPLQYDTLSMKYTATTGNIFSINHQTSNYPIGGKWFLKNIYHINQTSHGISYLTVSQMDYFYDLYQGILTSTVFGNYINEYGIYANGSYIQDMTTFGLENMSLSKHNYYYDLYQYYSSFEN
jgi:hypothetical protein